jgi:hypothetical protein
MRSRDFVLKRAGSAQMNAGISTFQSKVEKTIGGGKMAQ